MLIKIGAVTFESYLKVEKRVYDDWKFDDLKLPNWLHLRNLSNEDDVPPGWVTLHNPLTLERYYYREDGLALWKIINKFTKEILGLYYKCDDDVAKDTELQAWCKEIEQVGFAGSGKFPTSVTTLEDLSEICATFIFNGAVHHSVMNYAQWDTFAYVPYTPASLYAAPPGNSEISVEPHWFRSGSFESG